MPSAGDTHNSITPPHSSPKEGTPMPSAAENATLKYQADSYLEGLAIERRGYELKKEIATDDGDDIAAKKWQKRIDQVDAEVKRVGGTEDEPGTGLVTPPDDSSQDADHKPAAKARKSAPAPAV